MQVKSACCAASWNEVCFFSAWRASSLSLLPQLRHDSLQIRGVLKEPDRRNSTRARFETLARVFHGDTANRNHGNLHVVADFAKFCEALWRAKARFGRRCKYGSENHIVRAASGCFLRRLQRMSGHADQKLSSRAALCHKTLRFFNGHTVFTEVNACRPGRNGYIQPVIDEERDASTTALSRRSSQFCQFPPRNVLFSKLDPVHSGFGCLLNFFQEDPFRHGPVSRKAPAVGHVTQHRFTDWKKGAHEPAQDAN